MGVVPVFAADGCLWHLVRCRGYRLVRAWPKTHASVPWRFGERARRSEESQVGDADGPWRHERAKIRIDTLVIVAVAKSGRPLQVSGAWSNSALTLFVEEEEV